MSQWSDAQVDAATRVVCAGLPLEADERSQSALGKIARGRCMAPHCGCWKEGRVVVRAALDAASRVSRAD